jgi:hypothetical protein
MVLVVVGYRRVLVEVASLVQLTVERAVGALGASGSSFGVRSQNERFLPSNLPEI